MPNIPRRSLSVALLAALVLAVLVPSPAAAATAPPNSIASLGDSITRGFDACGWYVDCPARSFSTGNYSAVNSQYLRILAKNPAISGHSYNDAKTGAKASDVPGQASTAVGQNAQYMTMMIGANDACTSSETTMTPVSTFRASIDSALATLKSGLPNASIEVISIPDIYQLWKVGHTSTSALNVWSLYGICQSMLYRASSTSSTDEARRQRVRQRVIDLNAQLAEACTAYGANCRFDGNAVFNYPFALSEVSTWDYFHPNTTGQAKLAAITYAAGFNW